MGDSQLLAACGKYVANGERDAWVFLVQVELANAGLIPPFRVSWITDGKWFGPRVAIPPLNAVAGAQALGLEDGGQYQEALDSLLVKRSDIFTSIGMSMADASYWPNRHFLRNLKGEGFAKEHSFVIWLHFSDH